MRYVVTDRVAWSVGLSVTLVSPAKTAQPIDMPLWLRTRMCPRNHILDGIQIFPYEGAIFREKDMPDHAQRHSSVSCARTAEPIEMPFGLWTTVGPGKHVLGEVHTGAT